MIAMRRGPGGERRPRKVVRRAVVLMPNGLTLFNLFCGVYAIILAIRGEFSAAPAFIVLGGIADVLDGRVARATGTGSRFGEELDSLVDAISFGLAPAIMMYLELPSHGTWEWLFVFIFTACAVMRLARFNIEQAGRKKTYFHGLPTPAAGLTLATYYWFSQTPLYSKSIILFTNSTLSDLPWHVILRGLMAVLAALMISEVPYPTVPAVGWQTPRKLLGSIVVIGSIVLLLVRREEFIFPALLAYVLYGFLRAAVLGMLGRAGSPAEAYGDEEGEPSAPLPEARRPHPGRPPRVTAVGVSSETLDARPHGAGTRGDGTRRDDDRAQSRDGERPGEPRLSRRRRRRRGGQRGNRPPGSSSSPSSPPTGQQTSTPDTETGKPE
jgi:CDP-diacylglycerol--serine O-phosphatidyltransferase